MAADRVAFYQSSPSPLRRDLAFRLFSLTQDHGVAVHTAFIAKAKAQYAFQTVKRRI